MKVKEDEEMVKKLSELTVKELDKDMMDIELLVKNLMLVEPGEWTGMEKIIDTEDVVLLDSAKTNPRTIQIKWTDNPLDKMELEEGNVVEMDRTGTDMEIGHSGEEAEDMDTLKEVVVLEMPSGSKDDMEMEPGSGGVAMEMEIGIKYCPRIEIILPSYTFMETKAHSSRVWPDSNRFELDKPSVHTLLPGTMVSSAEQ